MSGIVFESANEELAKKWQDEYNELQSHTMEIVKAIRLADEAEREEVRKGVCGSDEFLEFDRFMKGVN